MESHQLILINLVIPLINPVPRGRSNIGELSGSRHISLISGGTVSRSCGLQLHKMDRQQNLLPPKDFFLDILSSASEKFPLEFVTMTMYCSGDLTTVEWIYIFYPLLGSLCAHEKAITCIWDYCFSKHTGHVQLLVNISEIYLKKWFCHVTANAINSTVTDGLDQPRVDILPVISIWIKKYFRRPWDD